VSCFSSEAAERRQLDALERGIEQDRFLVDRATPRVSEKDDAEGAAGSPSSVGVPKPGGDQESSNKIDLATSAASVAAFDDTSDMTPRMSIRIWGGGKGPPSVQVSETGQEAPANDPAPAAAGTGGASKSAYDAALRLVNARAYELAAGALGTFLLKWPDDPNASNASYWQAECYASMGEYSRAVDQLEAALERYPKSSRVPDCLLKLGLCQEKLGDLAKAKGYYRRLQLEFPESEAARRIPGAARAP
jgi:tol-pal system protein YbgF